MNKNKYLIFLIFLFLNQLLEGQVAIGEWRDHLPYYHAISVTAQENEIIAATEFSLFFYNKSSGELSKFSKIQGLSDNYSCCKAGENGLIINSWDKLEIFCRDGNANQKMRAVIGKTIKITRKK